MVQIGAGTLLLAGHRGGREQLLLLVQLRVWLKLMHELSTGGKKERKFHGGGATIGELYYRYVNY
jgi:hypothetical protein